MPELDNVVISGNDLFVSDMDLSNPTIFMYQTGYLTLKDTTTNIYKLGVPNEEVRVAVYKNLLPLIIGHKDSEVKTTIQRMQMALERSDVSRALSILQQLVSATPYSKMNLDRTLEEHFRIILTMTFSVCGYDSRLEVQVLHGIIDLVVKTSRQILLFEVKTTQGGGIPVARQQIINRGYISAFSSEPLPVVAVAIEFDTDKKQMVAYEVVE